MKRLAFAFAVIQVMILSDKSNLFGQAPSNTRPPDFSSAEISPERKITFRIHAPSAKAVRLTSSDLPGLFLGVDMTKADNDV